MPLLPVVIAVVTAVTPLCTPHRKMCSTELLCWTYSRMVTRTLATAVLSNEALCQFSAEDLEVLDIEVSVVFTQYVAVCNRNVEKKPKYKLIMLSTL